VIDMIVTPPAAPAETPPTGWSTRLEAFRRAHPHREARVAGVAWDSVVGGEGPPLLFLTGGLGFAEASFPAIERLERTHRVVAPTYPPLDRVGETVDGLVGLLDSEGVGRADVLGHSLGAGLAHVLVRRDPDRVGRLVLGSFGLYTRTHRMLVRAFLRLPEGALVAYYRRATARLAAAADPEEAAFLRELVEQVLAPENPGRGLDRLRLVVDLSDHPREYRLFAPVERPGQVLIIGARDDRGFSAVEREALIATYPGATVRIFPRGGHWVGRAQRAAHDATIDRFLRGGPAVVPVP
jgi:pimeloyl-ACP methyl ester carboxylesterase